MTSELRRQLLDVVRRAFARSIAKDGWTQLSVLAFSIERVNSAFAYTNLGYATFAALLAELPDHVEVCVDNTLTPGQEVARLRAIPIAVAAMSQPDVALTRVAPQAVPSEGIRRSGIELLDWGYVPDLPGTLTALAILALEERWWFGQELDTSFPILWNYLRYTFVRLRQEQKVKEVKQNEIRLAAFNTGLVDRRYEPVYALFRPNVNPGRQKWRFSAFCVAGEGRDGKDLVRYFRPLPVSAHYFDKVQDMIYDVTAGKPEVDWEHIIVENTDRLPVALLRENMPAECIFTDPDAMSAPERKSWFATLGDAIRHDKTSYRAIKNRLVDALELAIKRTEWNFKTAIPQYYIRKRKVTLLLPMAVVAEDHVDVALVVEKTPSGNYLGHTILSLEWAYMDARLVCRPDSDWLVPSDISKASEDDGVDAVDRDADAADGVVPE